jgi:hypothetical protein
MTLTELSQFNPDNENSLLYGDPEIFKTISMAATHEIITALQARSLDLTTDAGAMADLRSRLEVPAEIGLGITVIEATQAAIAMPDCASFLESQERSIGFCFSAGFERDGQDILELFVAIDPTRYPKASGDKPTDDQIEAVLELNHFLITQLLIGLDGDDTDDEPTDEQFEAMEDRADEILTAMLDAGQPPLIAVVPENTSEV